MMTEQATHTSTLMERVAPQLADPESDNDDGETIVRGENIYVGTQEMRTASYEKVDMEAFHQQIVDHLTEEAKRLAL